MNFTHCRGMMWVEGLGDRMMWWTMWAGCGCRHGHAAQGHMRTQELGADNRLRAGQGCANGCHLSGRVPPVHAAGIHAAGQAHPMLQVSMQQDRLTPYLKRSTRTKVVRVTTPTNMRALMIEPLSFVPAESPACVRQQGRGRGRCEGERGGPTVTAQWGTAADCPLPHATSLHPPHRRPAPPANRPPVPHSMPRPGRWHCCRSCPPGLGCAREPR